MELSNAIAVTKPQGAEELGVVTVASVLADYGGYRFRADERTTVTSSPDVDSWASTDGSVSASQSVAGSKPHLDTLSGVTIVDFNNTVGQYLEGDDAASTWNFMHQAPGSGIVAVMAQRRGKNGYICATSAGGSLNGFIMYMLGSDALALNLYGDTGGQVYTDISRAEAPLDTLVCASVRHGDGFGVQWLIDDGNSINNRNQPRGLGTGDAYAAIQLGAGPSGLSDGDVSIADIMFVPGGFNNEDLYFVQQQLTEEYGLGGTFADPGSADIALPATMWMESGATLKLFRHQVQSGFVRLAMSSSIGTHPTGRRSLDLSSASEGTFAASVAGQSASVVVTDRPTTWPTFSVCFIGDSNTVGTGDTTAKGFVGRFKDNVGANVTLLGTEGTTYAHEGYSGQSAAWFATNSASPLRNGSGFDIAAFETSLGAEPDVVFVNLVTNDVVFTAAAATTVTNLEAIRDALVAEWPSVQVVIGTGIPWRYPEHTDAERALWHATAKAIIAAFEGDANTYVIPTHTACDCFTEMRDDVHPKDEGHEAIAAMHEWWAGANV